jgi:hypothetical protein
MGIKQTVVCDACGKESRGPFVPSGWANFQLTFGENGHSVEHTIVCNSCFETFNRALSMLKDPNQIGEVEKANLLAEVKDLRLNLEQKNKQVEVRSEEISVLCEKFRNLEKAYDDAFEKNKRLLIRNNSLSKEIVKQEAPKQIIDKEVKCSFCGEKLRGKISVFVFSKKHHMHVPACKGCAGEIVFDIIPPPSSAPSGLPARPDDISPYQENAIRSMEGD